MKYYTIRHDGENVLERYVMSEEVFQSGTMCFNLKHLKHLNHRIRLWNSGI